MALEEPSRIGLEINISHCVKALQVQHIYSDQDDALALQAKEYYIFGKNYIVTPVDKYNGLSQVYCIKPEGRIH